MTINPLTNSLLLQLLYPSSYSGLNLLAELAGTSSSSSSTSTATSATDAQIAADQTQLSGLDQLSSALTAFQASMEGLLTPDQVAPSTASSSDATVATASALSGATTGTYNVTVNALAQAQSVEGTAFADPSSTVVGSGTLTIQLGTYDSGTNTFTPGASSAVSINVTNGSLDSIASAINSAGAGVTAQVVQDGSGYHLALTSTSTGAANGFSVSVTDSDGTNTDLSGLSQLAYDPTAAAGAGQNLTLGQAASDASLSVNGTAQSSASNSAVSIASGVTANLLQAGTTTVSVTQDTTALQTSAQNFVTAYNNLFDTLQNLTASGGALAGDATAQQLAQQLEATFAATYTGGSFSGLTQIGIEAQADGHLTLDSSALQSASSVDLSGTVSVLNQAASAMDTLANTYGGAGGFVTSDQSLLQNDVATLQFFQGLNPGPTSNTQYQAGIQQYEAALQLQTTTQLLLQSGQNSTSLFA